MLTSLNVIIQQKLCFVYRFIQDAPTLPKTDIIINTAQPYDHAVSECWLQIDQKVFGTRPISCKNFLLISCATLFTVSDA